MAAEGAPPFFAESIVFLAATVVAVPIAKEGQSSLAHCVGLGSLLGRHQQVVPHFLVGQGLNRQNLLGR